MVLPSAFVPGLTMAFLLAGVAAGSSLESVHLLHYYYLGLSEASKGQPWFTQDGYINDLHITHYDNEMRKDKPQFSWLEKMEAEYAGFWEAETENAWVAEGNFRRALLTLQNRYNQSGEFHTWQCTLGCELYQNESGRGYMRFAYDGKAYISLDLETLMWVTGVAEAQETKQKWEADGAEAIFWKNYLEKDCVVLLHKYLDYGKETLLRKEPPKMNLMTRMDYDGRETIVCRTDGFYPKDIHVFWKKNEDVWEQETHHGIVAPNSDGTYYTWISITVDSSDKKHFQCCSHHSTFKETLSCKTPVSPVNYAIKIYLYLGAVILVGFFLIVWRWCRRTSRPEVEIERNAGRIPEGPALAAFPRTNERLQTRHRLHPFLIERMQQY